jgi:hypothetical protein
MRRSGFAFIYLSFGGDGFFATAGGDEHWYDVEDLEAQPERA